MRFPSTPMSVRDRSSDHHGKAATRTGGTKTDKSTRVGDGRRKKGSAASKASMATSPRGKRVVMSGGQKTYHNR